LQEWERTETRNNFGDGSKEAGDFRHFCKLGEVDESMKCRFMITGFASGEEEDVKTSLEDSIKQYNEVDSFEVDVEEIKNTHCRSCGEWLDRYPICDECGTVNK
jgi:hypothetical protein